MKKFFIFLASIALAFECYGQLSVDGNFSDTNRIIMEISRHQPLKGAKIPIDIKTQIGATHVAGKYFFTKEPYLIEGSRKMNELGFGVLKLWFRKNGGGYPFNSNWNIDKNISLKELANHPYWQKCFDMPFSTFALSVEGAGVNSTDSSAAAEKKEIYELSKFLLEKYRNRNVTFIIHNWEGDWMMRGGTGSEARWSRTPGQLIKAVDGDRYTVKVPSDSTKRINAMAKWFTARQDGISKARGEVKGSKCKVYHAIEANKVMDSRDGIPGIVNSVLPLVETDMVSWSCYDGLDESGVNLYKGIQYIKNQIVPTKYMGGKKIVFLGEIGIPEQRYEGLTTLAPVVKRWDAYVGVCQALKVPYLIQWELYCNEPKDESLRNLVEVRTTDEMRGFWLIRPDGSKGFAMQYFDLLLRYAGKKIPTSELNIIDLK